MKNQETEKKQKYTIQLNVDMNAKLQGFDSAKRPVRAHHRLTKNFASPLLAGPAPSEDLLEMMTHMFTEEEAEAAQYLQPLIPRTAKQVARRCGRDEPDVAAMLDNLADTKRVVLAFGNPRRYTILPLVPGTFEMAIVSPDLGRINHWHKRFAELFEKVWDSEYIRNYIVPMPKPIRYLPTQSNASKLQAAWPVDRLEELLEPYDVFGIAHCQCRVVTHLAGRGCGKPTENCVAIGPLAKPLIDRGLLRKVDRQEVIEAKKIAEENGCITWMTNGMRSSDGNYSCSCCGCCCHALRTITQFNMPGFISAPHFVPRLKVEACNLCSRCVTACPMGAWKKIDGAMHYEAARCIGCGMCVTACKPGALELRPATSANKSRESSAAFMLKMLPVYSLNSFRVWIRRAAGI